MDNIKNKLKSLWQDKRTWKVRLPLATLTALAFTFTFFVFGPCEIYAQNTQDMQFTFSALLTSMFLAGALAFAVILGILLLLRGKIFNIAVSLQFAGTLAGYLQGNRFNIDHGPLTGDATDWVNYKDPMLANCVVWLIIFAAVLLLMYVSRRYWTQGLNLVCIVLVGVQIVALISLMVGSDSDKLWSTGEGDEFLSKDGIFELSPNNNVIVFLLDRLDNRYTDELLQEHPEWEEKLGDFTYYHDFTGSYANTRPAITYLFTGVEHDYSVPWDGYFHRAWTEPVYTLLPDIHEAGSRTGIYSDSNYVFGSVDDVTEFVDNIRSEVRTIDSLRLVQTMLDLSAYRYAPEAMKPYFQISTEDLGGIVSVTTEDETNIFFEINDVAFWREYQDTGLSIDPESDGSFMFYHLDAAHSSYMDENAEPIDEGGTFYGQVVGNMNMIFQYMTELKALGLYENSTIIIVSDHARPPWDSGDMSDVLESRVSTLMIKPAGVSGNDKMQISNKQVSQDNLRASIAAYFGMDTPDYGRTIESIGEDEELIRTVWMRGQAGDISDKLFTFKVTGDANDFSNWELVDTLTMDYSEL